MSEEISTPSLKAMSTLLESQQPNQQALGMIVHGVKIAAMRRAFRPDELSILNDTVSVFYPKLEVSGPADEPVKADN